MADGLGNGREELVELIGGVSGDILGEGGLDSALRRVVDLAIQVIDGVAVAGITLVSGSTYRTAAVTDQLVCDVDQDQYEAGDGPCLTALADQRVVRVGSTAEGEPQWPAFMAAARKAGVRSFLAAPICLGEESVGSVNLYGLEPELFEKTDEALVALVSGHAGLVIAHGRTAARAAAVVEQLETAMASRATIEQAKGVLLGRHGGTPEEAFDRLRAESQARNAKLRTVAAEVVAAASRLEREGG